MKQKKIILIKIFILFFIRLFGVDHDLVEFLEKNKGQLYYNPVLEQGIIQFNEKSILFHLNQSFFLVDQSLLLSLKPIYQKEGQLFIPQSSALSLTSKLQSYFREQRNVATILIDPGHGGKDPGAIGKITVNSKSKAIYEKNVVLKLCLDLYKRLKLKYPEKKVLLTRSTDIYPKLEQRVKLANSQKVGDHEAILFISVHTNASLNKKAKGFEVWYLPSNYKRKLINESELSPDMRDIAPILNAMLEEEYTIESVILAQNILKGMEKAVGKYTLNRGLKEESWFVVRNAKMPSVLIELGFITNSEEGKLLNQQSYLQKLSKGIYNGIENFIYEFELSKGFTE